MWPHQYFSHTLLVHVFWRIHAALTVHSLIVHSVWLQARLRLETVDEDEIELVSEFNKRIWGKALGAFATLGLRVGFHAWCNFLDTLRQLELCRDSATAIQRCWRGYATRYVCCHCDCYLL